MIYMVVYIVAILLLAALLYWAIQQLAPEPAKKFLTVILVVIIGVLAIAWLLNFAAAGGAALPPFPPRR